MKTLALLIALASPDVKVVPEVPSASAAAPKGAIVLPLAEASAGAVAEAGTLREPRAVREAVPEPEDVPAVSSDAPAGTEKLDVAADAAGLCEASRAYVAVLGEAVPGDADGGCPDVVLADAPRAREAVPAQPGVLPESVPSDAARIAALYHRRFLSGPWSAERRYKAALRRGDEAEARRMAELLDDLVIEAVLVREDRP